MAFLRVFEVDLCKIPGVRAFRTFSGNVRVERDDGSEGWVKGMPAGTSDILAIGRGGVFIAIEVKSKRGRLTKLQKSFLQMVIARGGIGMVARQEFCDLKKSSKAACAMLDTLMNAWSARREIVKPLTA